MSRREFHFADGSSNKFWTIELDETSHTVHFGRIGTAGQAQTKEFASEAEAKKSYEKLIAEKVKKGYVEQTDGVAETAAPMPKAKPAKMADAEPKKSGETEETSVAKPQSASTAKVNMEITHRIELEPEDWLWAIWRRHELPSTPIVTPFDFHSCQNRLSKLRREHGWIKWEEAGISPNLSRREAHYWFLALTENCDEENLEKLAGRISEQDVTGQMDLLTAIKRMRANPKLYGTWALYAAFHLLRGKDIVGLIQDIATTMDMRWRDTREAFRIFSRYLQPLMTPGDLEELTSELRPTLDPKNWPDDIRVVPPMTFYLAATLGMPEEMHALVQTWRHERYGWDYTEYHEAHRIVFGLGNSDLVGTEMRRLKLPLNSPRFFRAALALTEFSALDYLSENILAQVRTGKSGELLRIFSLVKAPEVAPYMLELKRNIKTRHIARQWLDEQVGNAICGLIPVATGRGKLAEAALDYLREAKQKGHADFIRNCLRTSEMADRIRKEVLDDAEKQYELLDDESTPAPIKIALRSVNASKVSSWCVAKFLPPIVAGEKRFNDAQVASVLTALAKSSFEKPDLLLKVLKENAEPASLDSFAWKLFELWQSEGSPSKEKWAMAAVGHFGGDVSALKITPLIRAWPGESQHQRAVFGLECLRAIGSDTALMQLNGIAQKLKFKGLKQKAAEAMEAIAEAKGLSRSQLEDRIVPDCDLDERGSRVFDFGPRQFKFVLGPDMKPMLKDADGKLLSDLPKPGAKDDAKKSAEAIEAWKLLKKQVKEVAKIQAERLEQAMVTGRRWSTQDFETLLVKHPLMTNLVRLIVWGGYDKSGKLVSTFRVTEDQTYTDQKDVEFKLKGVAEVGVLHPLHMTEAQKSAWGEVFSDYEIVPPFPQLGRTIYRLEKGEDKATELKRFEGIKMPAPTLVFTLEKLGWIRGEGLDGGSFDEHSKQFPAADVTAVVHYEGCVGMGYIDPNEELTLMNCSFVKGMREPSGYASKEKTLKLGSIDPVAVSEVLTDLTVVAAKGK